MDKPTPPKPFTYVKRAATELPLVFLSEAIEHGNAMAAWGAAQERARMQEQIDDLISHLDDAATHVKELIAERDALKAELAAIKGAGEPSTRPAVPLTDEQVWASEEIMAANAETGLLFSVLRKIVRAVEAAHNIKGTTG